MIPQITFYQLFILRTIGKGISSFHDIHLALSEGGRQNKGLQTTIATLALRGFIDRTHYKGKDIYGSNSIRTEYSLTKEGTRVMNEAFKFANEIQR
jgi:DNA-binding HxlR family transcriptional regulator